LKNSKIQKYEECFQKNLSKKSKNQKIQKY